MSQDIYSKHQENQNSQKETNHKNETHKNEISENNENSESDPYYLYQTPNASMNCESNSYNISNSISTSISKSDNLIPEYYYQTDQNNDKELCLEQWMFDIHDTHHTHHTCFNLKERMNNNSTSSNIDNKN
jgi:hypothetical protein